MTSPSPSYAPLAPSVFARTAFLGDSITDGNTYPLLVRAALAQAGLPAMIAINAGIGGDTAAGMAGRLERDVLAHRPTLVTFNAGTNDAHFSVSATSYEERLRDIAVRLSADGVPLILLAPNVVGPQHQDKYAPFLIGYEAAQRRVAEEFNLRMAEVNKEQHALWDAGAYPLADDGTHPNYAGQRCIARAVLDALGYPALPVPERLANTPFSGIISEWYLRPVAPEEPELTASMVEALTPDASWVRICPLLQEPIAEEWLDDNRALGMVVQLQRYLSGADRFLGVATVTAPEEQTRQLHTGAELSTCWLNGTLVYTNHWTRGWHAGRESVDISLQPGANRLVIVTGGNFFVSLTDGPMWP